MKMGMSHRAWRIGNIHSLCPLFYALLPLLVLSACGFRPVYGTQYQQERAVGSASLAQIKVVSDNSRAGQLLKAEIEDRLNPQNIPAEKRYTLRLGVAEYNIPLFVAPDGTFGRGNIQYSVDYVLTRDADGATINQGGLSRVSSYAASETNAIYASYVAQQDAKKRGVIEMASDVAMRMGNALDSDIDEEKLRREKLRAEKAAP